MPADASDIPVTIRGYDPRDAPACESLFALGRLDGQFSDNDTGVDMDDIENAYMRPRGNHLWVAETMSGEVVAMIGVQHHEEGTAEIRRLRVRPDVRRRGIGSKLVETALKFCADRNYLKVTLDTFVEHEAAIRMFEKFRFQHDRTRNVSGKDLLYFYLDIYRGGPPAIPQQPAVS